MKNFIGFIVFLVSCAGPATSTVRESIRTRDFRVIQVEVDYGKPLSAIKKIFARVNDQVNEENFGSRYMEERGVRKLPLVLVAFDKKTITVAEIESELYDRGLQPATLDELAALVEQNQLDDCILAQGQGHLSNVFGELPAALLMTEGKKYLGMHWWPRDAPLEFYNYYYLSIPRR